jgi:uncharacterized OB-fold protein
VNDRPSDPGAVDPEGRAYWEGCRERRLVITRCDDCGRWIHFPRSVCPACWSTAITPTQVSGAGTIYTFVLHHGDDEPYPTVVVELAEQAGLKIPATVDECLAEHLRVGLPVELTWIVHDGSPAPAFRPQDPALRPPAGDR